MLFNVTVQQVVTVEAEDADEAKTIAHDVTSLIAVDAVAQE